MMRDTLRQPTCVDEDQRGAVFADELRYAFVNLVPHLVRGDGAQFTGWHFDGKIDLPLVADLNNDGRYTYAIAFSINNSVLLDDNY